MGLPALAGGGMGARAADDAVLPARGLDRREAPGQEPLVGQGPADRAAAAALAASGAGSMRGDLDRARSHGSRVVARAPQRHADPDRARPLVRLQPARLGRVEWIARARL